MDVKCENAAILPRFGFSGRVSAPELHRPGMPVFRSGIDPAGKRSGAFGSSSDTADI
jgi:hypothetical protein